MVKNNPQLARGERLYAIGDIHGRLDLFSQLITKIREDAAVQPARRNKLLLIGDVIDRGPNSADLLRLLQRWSQLSADLIILRGNHEQMMVQALRGDLEILTSWLRHGGAETLLSWGLSESDLRLSPRDILIAAHTRIPIAILNWLSQLRLSYQSGDFLFVHAGIRPGVPLNEQDPNDLLWIRDDFLGDVRQHPAIIVHGHSISTSGPEINRNRINLDTGAYRTGRLSAVGFEAGRQWSLSIQGQERGLPYNNR